MPLTLASGSVDMTPAVSCSLGGYAGRSGPWRRIADSLEGALALLRAPDGTAMAILTLDALYPGAAVLAHARELASRYFGLPPAAVLVAASHTHGAPMLDASKPGIGHADAAAVTAAQDMLDRLFAVVAATEPVPVTIAEAVRSSSANVNRRLPTAQPSLLRLLGRIDRVTNAPNPAGPVDHLLRVVRFNRADGQAAALLWNFACHPTDFPDGMAVTADFIGVVRNVLRRRFGPIPVLFLQGFSGDVRFNWPVPGGLRDLRRTLLVGPHFPVLSPPQWLAWASRIADDALAAATAATTMEDVGGGSGTIRTRLKDVPLAGLVDGPLPQTAIEFQGLAAGPLRFVAASAEMLSTWGRHLAPDVIPVGCAGDTFGYLPDNEQAAAGGYEGRRFFTAFGLGERRFTAAMEDEVARVLSVIQGGL